MKYAVKLSTLKSTIADAHIGPYAPIDDKYALKGTGKMTISEEIETAQNCAEDAK